jgi:hypothetical protein
MVVSLAEIIIIPGISSSGNFSIFISITVLIVPKLYINNVLQIVINLTITNIENAIKNIWKLILKQRKKSHQTKLKIP